jgi:phosphatidate cytidylyltransferase
MTGSKAPPPPPLRQNYPRDPRSSASRAGLTRVLSALILLPALMAVVWFLPSSATLALAAIATLLACVEYAAMSTALGAHVPRGLIVPAAIAACIVVGLGASVLDLLMMAALVLVGGLFVFTAMPGPSILAGAASALFAIVYIGLPLGAIAAIHRTSGRGALLLLMITIIVSDSAQYYTGRAFGRAPLAPAISPKKTREGAIGGVVFGAATMVLGGRMVFPEAHPAAITAAAFAVVALGIIGDLFESLLKRSAGIKDSSALIPGHGGMLDRIDSWLFAGPAYYAFVRYLHS